MKTQVSGRSRGISVTVDYGISASLTAALPRDAIAGESARKVLERVAGVPQTPGSSASRTARVLSEALKTLREIDVELVQASETKAQGQPISLDHVLVARDEREAAPERDENAVGRQQEEIRIRLSESYVGGGVVGRR